LLTFPAANPLSRGEDLKNSDHSCLSNFPTRCSHPLLAFSRGILVYLSPPPEMSSPRRAHQLPLFSGGFPLSQLRTLVSPSKATRSPPFWRAPGVKTCGPFFFLFRLVRLKPHLHRRVSSLTAPCYMVSCSSFFFFWPLLDSNTLSVSPESPLAASTPN